MLFSGSTDGWSPSKFHELCDGRGPTITIFKSKAERVFGGFTQENWDSKSKWIKDERAFIYSIDKNQIYSVFDAQKAIYCYSDWGPSFGGCALGVRGDLLNKEDAGDCYTKGCSEGARYGLKSDAEGNHEVTGEGHN